MQEWVYLAEIYVLIEALRRCRTLLGLIINLTMCEALVEMSLVTCREFATEEFYLRITIRNLFMKRDLGYRSAAMVLWSSCAGTVSARQSESRY
jgi:hypothetical protein